MALTEIKTSGIADDAVTLAKQAGGTDGQIITYDASGNPVAVGPGTDGQVLTSTGAGSPPAFEAIPASGISDVVSDTSPQLGGNLDVNTKNITFGDSGGSTDDRLTFGAGTDLSIYHQASNSTSYLYNTSTDLTLMTGGTNVNIKSDTGEFCAKFVKDGAVELYHDNVKQCETAADGLAFPSGKGINFNATADASGSGISAGSELLDDYEEGSWTPSLDGTTYGGNSYGYQTQAGYYTKVGKQVTCHFYLAWNNFNGTGALSINGLPFSVWTQTSLQTAGAIMTNDINWPNGYTSPVTHNWFSTSYFRIYVSKDNDGWEAVQCDGSGSIIGTITYLAN